MTTRTPTLPTHRRRTIRVQGYDYAQGGVYFITICARNRESLWGQVLNGRVRLNETGRLVESVWLQTVMVRPEIELDAHIIIPNHFHAIFFIHESPGVPGATHRVAPTKTTGDKIILRGGPGMAIPPPRKLAADPVLRLETGVARKGKAAFAKTPGPFPDRQKWQTKRKSSD